MSDERPKNRDEEAGSLSPLAESSAGIYAKLYVWRFFFERRAHLHLAIFCS